MNKGQLSRELTEEGRQAAEERRARAQIRAEFLAEHGGVMPSYLDIPPDASDAEVDAAIDWRLRTECGGSMDAAVAAIIS